MVMAALYTVDVRCAAARCDSDRNSLLHFLAETGGEQAEFSAAF
jgi:hypothetical protein